MGYAKHVGRVGALAVLLGIGTAIAGPAAAETSTSEPRRSADSSSESSATKSRTGTPTTEVDDLNEDLDADEVPVDEDETVDDVENVDDDVDLEVPDDEDAGDEDTPAAAPLPETAPVAKAKAAGKPAAARRADTDDRPQLPAPADDPAEAQVENAAENTITDPNRVATEPSEGPASTTGAAAVAATAAATAGSSPGAPAPAPLVRQPVTPIGVLLGAPFALVNIAVDALNMLFSPAPTTPGDPPIIWGVLAFVQREIQRTFFNSSPYAVADSATTSEDVPTTISVLDNDTDPNDDTLTIEDYTQPANGVVSLNPDGTFTYTPNPDFNGTDTFTYSVTDAAGAWHVHGLVSLLFRGGHAPTTTVTIAVGAVNDAPTMNPDRPATDSLTGVVTADLNAEDVDGDPLTYEVTTPSRGTVAVVDGAFVYTPTAEARAAAGQGGVATDTFTVTLDDGNGGTASQTFTVAITPNIDNITIELRWGSEPRDLDSHLVGPSLGGGDPFHIYYANRNVRQADGTFAANLAADDVDGFGPELTTIYTRTPGEYLFYAHRYSTSPGLDVSEASVTVRDSVTGINSTFTISDEATGRYWSVFTLTISDTGLVTVTPVDTYSETAPTLPTAAPITL